MTAAELQQMLLTPDFKNGLEELSSCLASIMQEGPIVQLLAKCLWKQNHLYALERNKRHDLTVWTPTLDSGENETTIEFKFNYETCAEKIRKELKQCGDNLGGILVAAAAAATKKNNRGVVPRILKDIWVKKPNLFVWIICSRDLTGRNGDDDRKRINGWQALKNYRRHYQYKTDRDKFLTLIDSFLDSFQKLRKFSVSTAEIETNGYFPSTYYFRICDFAPS